MSKKLYAVFQGHEPGIYESWERASLQVKGYKGAMYKSFSTRREALNWLRERVIAAQDPVPDALIELIKTEGDQVLTSEHGGVEVDPGIIVIHTDGGASPNPGVGGYGVVLQKGNHRKELFAGYELTTNNRMEMMGVIAALEALQEPSSVILHTDSKYVVDSISRRWVYGWKRRGWKKSDGKQPENVDLWKKIIHLLDTHDVEFRWVKGHAGNLENERCDTLVAEAKKQNPLKVDSGYQSV